MKQPFQETDTIVYKIPNGFMLFSKPEPVLLQSAFGEYKATLTATEKELCYVRSFRVNKGEYPAGRYNEMAEFLNKVARADGNKVALKRK